MRSHQLREILRRLLHSIPDHDVPGLAAQLAYRFLFAVFPFGLFVAALGAFVAGWLGVQNPAGQMVDALGDNLPPDIASAVRPELEHVVGNTRPGLLSVGAIGALWAATGGTLALIKAMNRAYEVQETRPLPLRIGLAVGLTILASAGILVSFVTIVGGALLTQEIAEQFGLSAQVYAIVNMARWPAIFGLLVVAVAILFRLAPNVKASWRWVLGGAALFTFGWLLATAAFAFYIANFGNYGATYGSLGGVIVLMLWFYLTGLLLVGAAEVTAVSASVIEPAVLQAERDRAERAGREQQQASHGGSGRGVVRRVRAVVGADTADPGDGDPGDRRTGPADRRRAGFQRQPGAQ